MYKIIALLLACLFFQLGYADSQEPTPAFLYKVLSVEAWKDSQAKTALELPAADHDFIHFSKEDQLERITSKYWADVSQYVVLKVDVTKLPGKLVFETNPGGAAKYYHLYDGSIPNSAVVESKIVTAPGAKN